MNNNDELIMGWDILVAKKTQEVFFVVNGEGQPEDATFDHERRKVSFSLESKKCCLINIPQAVVEKLKESPAYLNIKDDKKMLMTDTAIKL